MRRSAQDLLTERRLLVNEMRRESDAMACAVLRYYIAEIDREIEGVFGPVVSVSEVLL